MSFSFTPIASEVTAPVGEPHDSRRQAAHGRQHDQAHVPGGQRAGRSLRRCGMRRCARRGAPAVHGVTGRRRAVDGCCAQYSPGQPSACDPERRGPGPDAAAPASGTHHPGADRRRRPRDRRDLPRPRPVRPAQRQRRPRPGRVGAGARRASRDRRRTQPASRRVQRRVQAVGRRGRLYAGRTRDQSVAAGLRQPGDRPVRAGQDRGLGQWAARAGRGRLQRPAGPAAAGAERTADRGVGRLDAVGSDPRRRRDTWPAARSARMPLAI